MPEMSLTLSDWEFDQLLQQLDDADAYSLEQNEYDDELQALDYAE
ncbi:hypothetical protein [Mesorhizobium sp. CN2-181]